MTPEQVDPAVENPPHVDTPSQRSRRDATVGDVDDAREDATTANTLSRGEAADAHDAVLTRLDRIGDVLASIDKRLAVMDQRLDRLDALSRDDDPRSG